ncbi:DUF4230 domain-containing protein [Draconibacterium sp. IB214405]|uniref:DUF4230 domain-containing protein n=1 Tax=Draconibacterium sp. IB214405 TaxID=3097352 RepID=UPI002A12DC46|nr:DUF4230 domain-containing protein [Draconibacterium sp. IB214405]MDX8340406.1 DUF4230 domain-containing protein [Draconibacterium sp. IB214405]
METLIFLGIIIGLAGGIAGTIYFYKSRNEKQLQSQSVLLLEKIKQVCKLITVEGEFSEIFTHRDEKNLFFKLFQTEKKALLIVKAKVMIGFDLTKINIEINTPKRQVRLSQFPEPEILSIDNDLEYYDVQKGIINKFNETDLTNMNKKSKEFIRQKVETSHLVQIAKSQATDTVSLIRQLIESVGWELVAEHGKLNSGKSPKELIS